MPCSRPLRAARILALATVPALLVAACSSTGARSSRDALLPLPVPASVRVDARAVAGLGTVLVDAQGRALYMFPPDAHSRVSCTGPCAGIWPPLVVADGGHASAGPGVSSGKLGTVADPNTGARDVTYGGYPLYRYSGDVAAGDARGQALFNSGGPWYVVSTRGVPVTTRPVGTP